MSDKNKSTITVDENDVLAFAKKIERNQFEDKSFADKIDDFVNGKLSSNEVLKIGTTPFCLRAVGANAVPLVVTQSVLENSLETTNEVSKNTSKKHSEQHDIPTDVIKSLPKAMRNPVLICKGNKPGTLIVVSEQKNKDNQNVIIPVHLNVKGKNSSVNLSLIHI